MSAINIFGGDDAFNALIYKPPSDKIIDFVKTGISSAIGIANNYSSSFVKNLTSMFDKFYSDEAIFNAKAVLYNSGSHVSENVIYNVRISDWNPNLIMQQYIMANPVVDKLYNKQMLDGFRDTYLNLDPYNKGTNKLHYQAVMDGVMQYDEQGEGFVCHYSLGDEVITKDLDIFEKLSILDTWESVEKLLAEGKDPTDLATF